MKTPEKMALSAPYLTIFMDRSKSFLALKTIVLYNIAIEGKQTTPEKITGRNTKP
jgi:hypothetical protein